MPLMTHTICERVYCASEKKLKLTVRVLQWPATRRCFMHTLVASTSVCMYTCIGRSTVLRHFLFSTILFCDMKRVSTHGASERGVLRSGSRFAARNNPYYSSYQQLIAHHRRLLDPVPAVSHRVARLFDSRAGTLIQTTVRFVFDSPLIYSTLREVFSELFREHEELSSEGFEVVVTFNAVLIDSDSSSYSLFYGQDHRAGNDAGAAPELRFGSTIIVRSMLDVGRIPSSFDSEALILSHRNAFANSNVRVHRFLNVIYLIYRYVSVDKRPRNVSSSRPREPEDVAKKTKSKSRGHRQRQQQPQNSETV